MTHLDPYLVVRAGSLYITTVLTAAVWLWRRPPSRTIGAAMLAFIWNVPAVLLLNLLARRVGWWDFDARGGLLLGVPVDLLLAWAWLWGAIPALALSSWRLVWVVALGVAFDLLLMPAAFPVVRLGPGWLTGEAIGLALSLVPSQLLARWTIERDHLPGRGFLQVVAFAGVMLFVLPATVLDATGGSLAWLIARPVWQLSLIAQLLALPAAIGLTAVQEFVTRGGGTPVPFDPPSRLVTTGVYAYIRNPMQASAVLLLLLAGLALRNPWIAAAAFVAHIYSIGFAGWDEEEDLRRRFRDTWSVYRGQVPRWRPRLRPWFRPDHPSSRLYVSERCGMCRDVAMWFARRGAGHLAIVPAEQHPSGALRRITYEPGDGSPAASGIEAIARALEHIHLGWALVGFVLRLPVVSALVQLLADASGAEPRLADEVPPSGLERSLRRNVSTHEHAVSPGRFIRALHAARRPRPRGDGRGLSRP
jgi:protein-S-isoprenylcysteine O-methyltransferase Ste14